MNDTRSRKWQVTINNPSEKGMTHEYIKLQLGQMKSVVYWCMSDEIGENGTYHTHIFIAAENAIRFTSLKKKFPAGHFEMARGTSQQNRDYVFKLGKWLKDKKAETNILETHEEYGNMPMERQGQRNDLADLYDMVKQGMSNYEILESSPQYIFNIEKIERARQLINEEKYKSVFRKLNVTYIFGSTGTGKSRSVFETYPDAYRVTDYDHPFDSYSGQDVIVFEEFRNSIKIQDMLSYLDGYPLKLPARYSNKVACYTKVFIISNWPFEQQYEGQQMLNIETYLAFKRRITNVIEYTGDQIKTYPIFEYPQLILAQNYKGRKENEYTS